jgi:hypothetical protein
MRYQYDDREKFIEPTNEKGVFYLFSRHHEELGFEEIVEFKGVGSKSSGMREQRENKASPIIIVIEDFFTNLKLNSENKEYSFR